MAKKERSAPIPGDSSKKVVEAKKVGDQNRNVRSSCPLALSGKCIPSSGNCVCGT